MRTYQRSEQDSQAQKREGNMHVPFALHNWDLEPFKFLTFFRRQLFMFRSLPQYFLTSYGFHMKAPRRTLPLTAT